MTAPCCRPTHDKIRTTRPAPEAGHQEQVASRRMEQLEPVYPFIRRGRPWLQAGQDQEAPTARASKGGRLLGRRIPPHSPDLTRGPRTRRQHAGPKGSPAKIGGFPPPSDQPLHSATLVPTTRGNPPRALMPPLVYCRSLPMVPWAYSHFASGSARVPAAVPHG